MLYVVTPQFAEQARILEKNWPGKWIEVFKVAGHVLFVDEPQQFNAFMLHFAASV